MFIACRPHDGLELGSPAIPSPLRSVVDDERFDLHETLSQLPLFAGGTRESVKCLLLQVDVQVSQGFEVLFGSYDSVVQVPFEAAHHFPLKEFDVNVFGLQTHLLRRLERQVLPSRQSLRRQMLPISDLELLLLIEDADPPLHQESLVERSRHFVKLSFHLLAVQILPEGENGLLLKLSDAVFRGGLPHVILDDPESRVVVESLVGSLLQIHLVQLEQLLVRKLVLLVPLHFLDQLGKAQDL